MRSLSTWFISLKLWVVFSILTLSRFPWTIYLFSTKSMNCQTLNVIILFKIKNNRKNTHNFAPRPLIYKLQKKVWKFNHICVSWSSRKNWPGDKMFKLKKWKFWVRHFFSIVPLSKYLTFLYWITYLFLFLTYSFF